MEKFTELVGAMYNVHNVHNVHNDARVQFQSFQYQSQSVAHQLAAHSHTMEIAYAFIY